MFRDGATTLFNRIEVCVCVCVCVGVCVCGGEGYKYLPTCRESFVDKSFQTLTSEASNEELTPLLHPIRLAVLW